VSEAPDLLLDTHAWVWTALGETARFSGKTMTRIDEAAQGGHLLLAAISLWEVAMLQSKGRLRLSPSCSEWLKQAVRITGVRVVPLDIDVAAISCDLPGFHGDPADRQIVASVIHHNATLLTEDEDVLAFARKGGYRVSRLK
jgi:PIN domain nuclease of toxin-antitoxin system